MRHLMTVDASTERRGDVPGYLKERQRAVPVEPGRGPEEIALDAWLEDAGPYVSLVEVVGSVAASLRAPQPRGRRRARPSAPLAPLAFD